MMSERQNDPVPTLTIKGDKINYAWLIGNQVLTYQKLLGNIKYTDAELREVAVGFTDLVVDSLKDDQWEIDINNAKIIKITDIRPIFCTTPVSIEHCLRKKIPIYQKTLDYDSHKLIRACMNLFDRRGYLTKKAKIEKMLGERFAGQDKDS